MKSHGDFIGFGLSSRIRSGSGNRSNDRPGSHGRPPSVPRPGRCSLTTELPREHAEVPILSGSARADAGIAIFTDRRGGTPLEKQGRNHD